MGLEWEGDVTISVDFSSLKFKDKLDIILEIMAGKEVEFTGGTHIEIEPPERY